MERWDHHWIVGSWNGIALRFLQIFIPEGAGGNFDELLEGQRVLGTWRGDTSDQRIVLHLLVPAEATEPIMDRFEEAFGTHEGFCIVVLPVEAVLPRPDVAKEADQDSDADVDSDQDSTSDSGRVSREELYSEITETLGIDRVFLAMTILSSVVAAVGLLRDDVAVIIGAMVIAPLLGPNVAMSLATTLGDLALLRRALLTNVVGVTVTLLVALGIGILLEVDPKIPAIQSRTEVNLGDLTLALAAGAAGTFAFTRGMSSAVIGVMVAVALMPPLVTFGMLFAEGAYRPAAGAMMLVMANVVSVNLTGVATFIAQGVRPRSWWEEEQAKRSTRIAIAIWVTLLIALIAILLVYQNNETLTN
ncbi:hypothetical protein Pan14r_01070 [Crateriforma conspicua]|uniref:TIGR00341 family protein n=1 Tax=Crateriforma conspicua TaxID=2527996 RepID=A0A5C5XZ90_9PLAN|nr:hypothetical protein Pan14r_01070 [Crateriforma conspicua]